jgi:hypothetical protein
MLRWNQGGRKVSCHRQDARREDHEIEVRGARACRWRMQHQEDRRVRMVVADRADGVEAAQVVLVRRVVAMPATTSSGEWSDRRATAGPGTWPPVRTRPRRPRTPRSASGSRADWPGRWSRSARGRAAQHGAEVLADIAARRAIGQLDAEADTRAESRRSPAARPRDAQFGHEAQRPCCGTISISHRRCRSSDPSCRGWRRRHGCRCRPWAAANRCRPW